MNDTNSVSQPLANSIPNKTRPQLSPLSASNINVEVGTPYSCKPSVLGTPNSCSCSNDTAYYYHAIRPHWSTRDKTNDKPHEYVRPDEPVGCKSCEFRPINTGNVNNQTVPLPQIHQWHQPFHTPKLADYSACVDRYWCPTSRVNYPPSDHRLVSILRNILRPVKRLI